MKSALDSIRIGSLTAKNRIIRSATNDHLCNRDATISDAQIDMYEQLASHDVGTIITGHMSIVPDIAMRADEVQPSIGDDSKIEGLSRIPAKIHEYGGLAVAQISHAGPRGMVPVDINTMDAAEFRQIEQWFVDAAVRAQRAGFDAVEVHAAHWYLLATMLNSDLNKRADGYNGSDERRIAIVCRIVEAIRQACPGLAVFVKINAHNTLEGIDDTGMLVNYAKALYEAGIDLLDVSGMSFTKQPRDAECYFLDSARAVKEALPELNVALVGGIYSRATIDRALKSVDMVAMGRTLLTQPDFVTRLKNGELERSRCIRCNQCFKLYKTKFERCIFGPVNPKLRQTFGEEKS